MSSVCNGNVTEDSKMVNQRRSRSSRMLK